MAQTRDSALDTTGDRPGGVPFVLKAAVVVLAAIGLFSISGFLVSTAFWLLRALAIVLVVIGGYVVVRAFVGRRRDA